MVRTQVRLTRKQYHTVKREARRLGISVAELLRRAPWMRYAGMVESIERGSEAGRRIDDVVYGEKS